MKLTLLLCDAAQVADGKLYVLGGGWSVVGPGPTPMAIAAKVDVPWHEATASHAWTLELTDDDGAPVWIPTSDGNQPVEVAGEFQAYQPEGLKPGTPLDVPLVVNFGPLPLAPGRRYVWRFHIDGHTEDTWQAGFTVRDAE